MKDNTNLAPSSKREGLKIAFNMKIMTTSCRIDLTDCNHLSNSLVFKSFYRMVVCFVLHKSSISLILAITSSGLLIYTNAHVPVTAHFMYVITKEKKMPVSHSIVSDREIKQVNRFSCIIETVVHNLYM